MSIEEIQDLVRDLNVADGAAQDRGQEPLHSICSNPVSLQDSIHLLIQSTNTVTSRAQSVELLAENANSFGNLPITEVCPDLS